MEATTFIPKTFLACAESAEVLCRLGHNVAVELEDDSCRWACAGAVVRFSLVRSGVHGLEVELPSFTVRSK